MSARPRRRLLRGSTLLLAVLLLTGCQQQEGSGPGGRAQHLALTPEQELSLGTQAYKETLSKARTVDGADLARVRRVGERIAEAARFKLLRREIKLHVDDKYMEWQYAVLKEDQTINAFCLPGGKVAVYTGLLRLVDSDDELAAVMGHEASHALAHHSSERLYREQMQHKAVEAANGSLGRLGEGERRVLIGVLSAGASLKAKSYDRAQESEADHIGLFLMTFAGYRPEAAVSFWEKMQRASARRGHTPEILSDHPSDAKRLAQLQAWLPRAKAAFAAYKAGRVKDASR